MPVRTGVHAALPALVVGVACVLSPAGSAADPPPVASPPAAPNESPPDRPASSVPLPATPPPAPMPAVPGSGDKPSGAPHLEHEEPALRVRLIAPSARGRWLFRIDNEGDRYLRVPADVRLLRLTIEPGDTTSKSLSKPVKCNAGALPPATFPDRRSLLLGPGESYVEAFDPRLLCFGKDSSAIQGGAIVRARFGWEEARGWNGKKPPVPPFAVEDTAYPPVALSKKILEVPTILLSYRPPEEDDSEQAASPGAGHPTPPLAAAILPPPKPESDRPQLDGLGRPIPVTHPPSPAPAPTAQLPAIPPPASTPRPPDSPVAPAAAAPPVVDQNAPRLEAKATAFLDTVEGHNVSLTFTLRNVGRRPTLVALRPRMMSFQIQGPDGPLHCPSLPPGAPLNRDSFQSLKPGGEVSLPVLVEEACGGTVFRRAGLYRIWSTVRLTETGSALGLLASTGHITVAAPTLLRVQVGEHPFYATLPAAVKPQTGSDSPAP